MGAMEKIYKLFACLAFNGASILGQGQRAIRQPSHDDELKFSGVPRRGETDIPSKSFHKLQMMTGGPGAPPEPEQRGGSEIDTTSLRSYMTGGWYNSRQSVARSVLPSTSVAVCVAAVGKQCLNLT